MPHLIGSIYVGVFSRESLRITFTYAVHNILDLCATNVRNSYLQAPLSQKDYIVCGPEFGLENVGKVALIQRNLYSGKSEEKDSKNNLRSCMRYLEL